MELKEAEYEELIGHINQERFYILYQPKVGIECGQVVGAEALIRYKNKENTLIGPDVFIPYYEDNGLIYIIDFYMLRQVSCQIKTCRSNKEPIIPISINICMQTLLRDDFYIKLEEAAREEIAMYIELEITERNIPYEEINHIRDRVKQIRELGFKVAVDDFGTGNSNLLLITKLDITTLKIDKSVIDDVHKNIKAQNILQALIEICTQIKIEVVIEGVETKKQLDKLRKIGSKVLQGYYFSKPIQFSRLQEYFWKSNSQG